MLTKILLAVAAISQLDSPKYRTRETGQVAISRPSAALFQAMPLAITYGSAEQRARAERAWQLEPWRRYRCPEAWEVLDCLADRETWQRVYAIEKSQADWEAWYKRVWPTLQLELAARIGQEFVPYWHYHACLRVPGCVADAVRAAKLWSTR